ncbi:MAG: ParB/RepB/Spo0J family partition protein [Clostridia bacterium]|nr:ParB/RepB/Spo0J family partition protein [Clostridia bacterium]
MLTKKPLEADARQLCWLPLDSIRPNRMQPRREFDDQALMELAASICENGLLQPVTVRPCGDGYELIMGERRCRACRLLGHTHIEAFVLPADDAESALLALVENVQRQNLHFFEEAEAYARLRDAGMSQETLARLLGKSVAAVSNRLRLLRLEESVREAIVEGGLTERHARALLPLPGEAARLRAANQAAAQKLSVQKTEELVSRLLERLPVPLPSRRVVSLARDPRLYLNALRGIVRQMQDAGLDAQYETLPSDTALEVRILVPLHKKTAVRAASE